MNENTKGSIFLFLAALIWGSSFVSQSAAMDHIGPFTFNTCRSFVGFLVLIPVVYYFRKAGLKERPISKGEEKELNKHSVFAGIVCGLALVIASSFQQVGVSMTTAGKAGFITALYIIMVPILSVFLGRRIPLIIWLSAIIALIGFYFLCIQEDFSMGQGDFYCLICAFCFSIQIMTIDHFTKKGSYVDPVMMSMTQFFVVGVVSLILTLLFETPVIPDIIKAGGSILYAGALSSGVAYTFQILGQKHSSPAVAPLIMSLESVFAVLFGWLLLGESMNSREILGCFLVFTAVMLSQIKQAD